jgi:predicted NBD/HSP70 family sugar kinase
MSVFVGIDIGGSHVGLSIFSDTNQVLGSHEESLDSSISPQRLVERFVEIINVLMAGMPFKKPIAAVGIGCPGQSRDGILVAAANFKGWGRNVPLASMMSRLLNNIPVTLVNDADAAIAAEVWGTNEYKNVKHVAMISMLQVLILGSRLTVYISTGHWNWIGFDHKRTFTLRS